MVPNKDEEKYMNLIEKIQVHIKDFSTVTLTLEDLETILEYCKCIIPFQKKAPLDGDLEYAFGYLYVKNESKLKGDKYSDIYSFLNSYPELSSTKEDLNVLRIFANTVNIITKLKYNFPKANKAMYLKLSSKLSEGWNANYTTGGGQSIQTTIRTNIISKETGIYPKKLLYPRNRKSSKLTCNVKKSEKKSLKCSFINKNVINQKQEVIKLEFYNDSTNYVDLLIKQNESILEGNHECYLDSFNQCDLSFSDMDLSCLFD